MGQAKKPNKFDKKTLETRGKIIRASIKLFARQGFNATTAVDIANAIKMTQGAMFHHYASKETLLFAVVDHICEAMKKRMVKVMEHDAGDRAQKFIECIIDFHYKEKDSHLCMVALTAEFAGRDHPIIEMLRKFHDELVDMVKIIFGSHSGDQHTLAICLVGAIQGLALQNCIRNDNPSFNHMVTTLLEASPVLGTE